MSFFCLRISAPINHGYERMIGEGKALNPENVFIVSTELFGNGRSSSPSNTPEPFHGPRFPVTTIRDNVRAVHQLLVDELGISHLRALIGYSMGAEQACSMGCELSRFCRPYCGHSWHGKVLPAWLRPVGGTNC